MFSSQLTSLQRAPRLFACTLTLLAAALFGPSAAHADTVTITNYETFPTVGDYLSMDFTVTAYGDSTVTMYRENGRTSCPATVDEAVADGMEYVNSRTVAGDGVAHPMAARSWASAEGAWLFCAYTYRDADPATMRGTAAYTLDIEEEEDAPIVTVAAWQALGTSNSVTADVSCPRACSLSVTGTAGTSSAMDVALGTATATIGTFGGSTTVRVPMTTAQRRDLRTRISAGQSVRADLVATATFGNGESFDTSATTALRILTIGTVATVPVRTYIGV